MAFSTVLVGTLIIYAIYYACNVGYDLFFSGMGDTSRAKEDDEIEINEADNTLQPTSYNYSPSCSSSDKEEEQEGDDDYAEEVDEEEESEEPTNGGEFEIKAAMNGSLTIDALLEKVEKTEFPTDLDIMVHSWNAR